MSATHWVYFDHQSSMTVATTLYARGYTHEVQKMNFRFLKSDNIYQTNIGSSELQFDPTLYINDFY